MEQLNIDFKGPLPSVSKYKFPFAIPCKDFNASTVNNGLCQIFSLFGVSAYIHSDKGSSFMSEDLKGYLHSKGIVTSRTTSHNPQGSGLVERYNGTIWKAVTLALKPLALHVSHCESVLPDALHSVWILISTANQLHSS